jgi:DNA-binding transcriptional MerR regulator
MGYRIKTVSDITGIPKNTLVAWERRYGVLNPRRLSNGYRMYTDKDVAVLVQLKGLLNDGYKISEAVDLIASQRAAQLRAMPAGTDAAAYEQLRADLEGALLGFGRAAAEQVVRRLANVHHVEAIRQVYFPLLRSVGDGWERGDVSVAQEHFASSFVRDQLVSMLLQTGCGPPDGPHVACATLPGEHHELGLLGLAVHLALSGKRVTYLGADMPTADLCRFATSHHPRWICLSALVPASPDELVRQLTELRDGIPETTELVVGGAGADTASVHKLAGVTFVDDWFALRLDTVAAVLRH